MARPFVPISLTDEERQTLRRWLGSPKADERLILRGSIILLADRGVATGEIARRLRVRSSTVSRWRSRFAQNRLVGLQDRPRSGKPRLYDSRDGKRVLDLAESRPPKGQPTWTGEMISERLGDVSADFVWKVLRSENKTLRRRRRFRVPVEAPFEAKNLGFGGLFLSPPENALVLMAGADDRSAGVSRVGMVRLPGSRAFHFSIPGAGNPLDLLQALEIAVQLIRAKEYPEQARRHFLDFMDQIVSGRADREIHVFLNTMRTHKPGRDQWLAWHPRVRFHYLTTFDAWLAQLSLLAEILHGRTALQEEKTYIRRLEEKIIDFYKSYDRRCSPFEWILVPIRKKNNID